MSLRAKAVSGVKWISSSTAGIAVLSFVQTAVLSRLLEPEDFGVMAMMWVVMGFAQLFSDMGMANAIVQRQQTTPEELSSVFWATWLVGAFAALMVCLVAPWAAAFYREETIARLMPMAALGILLGAIGQPFQMLLQRNLRFDRLAAADLGAALASLAVAGWTAWSGYGAWSLVYGNLAAASVKAVSLVASGARDFWPVWRLRWEDLRGFARFGAYQMGERITNYTWNNYDYLLVGKYLGAAQLGVYRLAYETVVRPLATINPILNTVSYPLFARKQNDNEALRRGYLELLRLLGTITFPLLAGLAAVTPLAVETVFGAKWLPATPVIRILCLLGALRSLTNPSSALLLAKNRVHVGFWANLLFALACVTVFSFTAPLGVVALSWSALGVMVLLVGVSWKFYYWDTIEMPWWDWVGVLARPAAYSLAMAVAVALFEAAAIPKTWPVGFRLAAAVGFGGVVYTSIYAALERDFLRRTMGMLMGSKGESV